LALQNLIPDPSQILNADINDLSQMAADPRGHASMVSIFRSPDFSDSGLSLFLEEPMCRTCLANTPKPETVDLSVQLHSLAVRSATYLIDRLDVRASKHLGAVNDDRVSSMAKPFQFSERSPCVELSIKGESVPGAQKMSVKAIPFVLECDFSMNSSLGIEVSFQSGAVIHFVLHSDVRFQSARESSFTFQRELARGDKEIATRNSSTSGNSDMGTQ
jgi:hypothetical protein